MLTPHDVEIVEFPKKMFGGYNEEAVDEFLDEVVHSLLTHIENTEKLTQDIARLTAEIEAYKAKEKLLSDSVALAQKTRDQVIDDAKREAEIILREARLDEVRIKNDLSALKSERDTFEFEFYGLLMGFIKKLEARKNVAFRSQSDEGIRDSAVNHDVGSSDSSRRTI